VKGDVTDFAIPGERPATAPGRRFELPDGEPFVCSWSGGKDSCLALLEAARAGGRPAWLLCMADETGERTMSHSLPAEFVAAQAAALGARLLMPAATWESYEQTFIAALREIAASGVCTAVFGDIDLEPHREWEEKVCAEAGMRALLPLWLRERAGLMDEVFAAPISSVVVTTDSRWLGREFVGRELTPELVAEMTALGVDAAGEVGEYHTGVVDCPLFSRPVPLRIGEPYSKDGYWFANTSTVAEASSGIEEETR
jgi:diphthine-ammonia ligase